MLRDRSYIKVLIGAILSLILIFLWSLGTGRYDLNILSVSKIFLSRFISISPSWDIKAESVLFTLRLPRALAAVLVGGALALSGGSYQGVFKNPLVSPDMLGVSAGASVGAGIGILMNQGILGIQISSFIGGIIAVMLTSNIPKILRNNSDLILVLSGVIVGGLMNSLMGIIKYMADSETQLPEITYWQMGSLARVSDKDLIFLGPIIIVFTAILLLVGWRINILSLGEKEARSLGVDVGKFRGLIIICSTILTASSVCISGTIGWVGLVIPHFSRMIIGPDNNKMLPLSFVFGASFMLLIDTLARALTSSELPLTILTGLIGAPFYLFLLVKQRMKIQ